ncbi:hypothetical protein [Kitasatospora sp. A2-31]|uniref:hypothetical protein n=1 Tax=Kitasatospora sp. A2-31 TaxID=2916414 RepID=UPI001EE80589|nr:hypothetical protein [Kitasatospora sp. A2-31]MCG6493447.1 hypothetical protein [Kitasatospora sp. A2-31]
MPVSVPFLTARAAGSRITGATYQQDVTDAATFLTNRPLFKGYQSAAQAISSGSLTALLLDTEVIDSYNGHDLSVNTSRWTCPAGAAGYYSVLISVGLVANAVGDRVIEIHKNGTVIQLGQFNMIAPTAGVSAVWQAKTIVPLSVADYVEGKVYQTSGGSLNTVPTQTGMTVQWEHA